VNVTSIFLGLILVLNITLAGIVVFKERRDAGTTWAWLLVLSFIPVLGFVLYVLFGGLHMRKRRLFQWEALNRAGYTRTMKSQLEEMRTGRFPFRNAVAARHRDMILMQLANNQAVYTEDNEIEIITDGEAKFARLFEDIRNAKHYIHLQYYIIRNDALGKRLIDLLTEKAREGVQVRVLYDSLGSRTLTKRFFREFREAGGQAEAFFPSRLHFINLRINYRNHRKLVVIDGVIGYVGGFNVGDEYLGLHKRFGYWRDTHLRVRGSAVYALQTRFILDWNQASQTHDIEYSPELYPEVAPVGETGVQIVTSGPASRYEHIKNGYLKMIASARRSIHIQTPYFIPDHSVLDALRVASLSGVDVQIMIPNKPDHPFVHWASLSYVGEVLKAGAKVYLYRKGFLHAKMIVVDGQIASVGTANLDMRSFRLNFEVNAFLYHRETARRLNRIFMDDLKDCEPLTMDIYDRRPLSVRFKESVSRLLSPIL
jgi:cardiolipin synthase